MRYLSVWFLLFTAAVAAVYYLLPKKCKPAILLVASLAFYVLSSRWLVIPVLCLTALLWGAGLRTAKWDEAFAERKKDLSKEERKAYKQALKKKKRLLLALECCAGFGMLVAFKYLGFLAQIANGFLSLFSAPTLPTPAWLLPLGISYYTLSMIGYAVDVYYGRIAPEKNFFRLLLFAVYFPHIVEGPIADYPTLSARLYDPQPLTFQAFLRATELIVLGLVKKMVFADRAGMLSNAVFDKPQSYHFAASAAAIVLYAVQLYLDFSGCIDLVRGVSALFGIELQQNFRRPFFSRSIQEFWRRWHITLGSWIKNYIFYPLSLSKRNARLTARAGKCKNVYYRSTLPMLLPLLFVWLFMGVWHGASWKYVLYGLYYYILIALGLLLEPLSARICAAIRFKRTSRVWALFQMVRTIVLVLVGLTLFRADTTMDAIRILRSVFSPGSVSELFMMRNASGLTIQDLLLLAAGVLAMAALSVWEECGHDLFDMLEKRPVLRWIFCTAGVLLVILFGVYGTAYTTQPFVYAQF